MDADSKQMGKKARNVGETAFHVMTTVEEGKRGLGAGKGAAGNLD